MEVTTKDVVEIDGARGEGGGQVLRSALACSLLTGRPFRIRDIRGRRKKPGLLRQHLAGVRLATRIGAAEVRGDELRSGELWFRPQTLQAGTYESSIGSAGSTTLVLQTVLVPLLRAQGRSVLSLRGGTHNPMAPTFDYIDRVYLPMLRRMGAVVEARMHQAGFFPAGGGHIEVTIEGGAPLRRLDLLDRGAVVKTRARAYVANLPRSIAERELRVVGGKLRWRDLEVVECEGPGPGNVLSCEVRSEHVSEVFTSFGEQGLPAGKVATRAVTDTQRYLARNVPAGEYLADQLLLPLALTGGRLRTGPLSQHTTTNLEVLSMFLPLHTKVTELSQDTFEIELTQTD